jgi:TrwC relaxase/AAA domain-containing protein/CHC2-type zinc finger protein
MMTFAKIAAGSPSKMGGMTKHMLTQSVPKEVADLSRYYTRENELGENEARLRRDMHPLAAQGLGVDPEKPVGMDEINALLSGHRADGEKIEGKTYSQLREYVDPKTGETKTKVPIGSVDFCMTPDKSVSVAWAFADAAEQAAIYQAHSDAANATMAYVEQHMGQARVGKGGSQGYEQGHVGWIEFNHYTSRPTVDIVVQENGQNVTERVVIDVPGDMDLHRHVTIPNAVFCESGRVGSMDLDRLDGFVKESGALYQAHLAQNLRNLGADVILDPDTGAARLTAIPDHVRTHFSKRTTRGEDAVREYARTKGHDWDELSDARKAGILKKAIQSVPKGLDERILAKLKKDDMADFSAWKEQARKLGWSFDTIVKNAGHHDLSRGPHPEVKPEIRHEVAHPIAAEWLEKELNKRAVITEHDLRTAAARSLIHSGIKDHTDIDGVVGKMLDKGVTQYGEKTTLISGKEFTKQVLSYTTALHERDENEFIAKARRASDDLSKALNHDRLTAAVERSGLNFQGEHGEAQLKAIHQIGKGGALSVMIGSAGAGKTTILKPLVDAWKEDGRRIYGIALAWRQADDLIDAGIARDDTKGVNDARAISVFLDDVAKGKVELDHKSVVVVDELSLLGTRQSLNLLRLRDKHDFQLVMIGDDKQCQSIDAGPIIDLARKALGPEKIPEILTTIRQKSKREREIAGLFRGGEAGRALTMKREDKTVELVQGGPRQAAARIADLVAERMRENAKTPKYSITVSAPTNSDAHQLSIAIREKRREMGLIAKRDLVTIQAAGAGDKSTYEMKLAQGDKVRLFKNVSPIKQRGSLGRNGSILTVVHADKQGVQLRNADGREGYVPWERLTQKGKVRLAYGEVMTTHTAQGSTATEHIYAMPQGTKAVNGFSSYSSGTRHEQKSFMVISAGAERAEVVARRPVNDPRPIKEEDLWSNAARNLGYQPEKITATDFLKNAVDVQRSASRGIQQGLQPAEQRQRQGLEPTTVHVRTQMRQETAVVGQAVQRIETMTRSLEPTVDNLSRAVPSIGVAVQQTIESVARGHGRTPTRLSTFQPLPREKIDELKRSVSITHLISQHVKLDNHGKGLCHFHDEKTPSFHVDERKGRYRCFGCGAGGDSVKWLTDGLRMSFPEALDYLSGKSGIELPKPEIQKTAGKEADWVAVLPVPSNAPPLLKNGGWTAEVFNPRAAERGFDRTAKAYKPAHVATYRDAAGNLNGYVLRVEMADGGKYTPQVTWAVPSHAPAGSDPLKVGRWALVTMGDSRPLYRGEEIARNPDKPVIVVMGEKKADALQKTLGDGAVVVSWAGGDNGRFYTDFSAIKGRNVIIWPDADAGGKAAAVGEVNARGETKKGVADFAREVGATGVKVIVPPTTVEKGWDAGDLIKSGAGRAQVRQFIAEKVATVEAAKKEFAPAIQAAQDKQVQGRVKSIEKAVKPRQSDPSRPTVNPPAPRKGRMLRI